ncbi:site-2 protease family protein [Kineosporia sp. R_H_3]|uniref:site-2 protease family protein n=1 Tax=Kineosporia sp. R_H_3 TaxID=1961848 RepID=UPI000B4B4C54|nr:site-2 protease family protein [Kineosporia sp. R_H_3]
MAQTQAPPEHAGSFRLGSVAGTPVYLRRSWFFIAVVIAFLVGPQVASYVDGIASSAAYLVGLGFAALLLGSVFLHELAHAVAARAVGTPPTDIVLDLWGGHTAFSEEIRTPGRSILVAGVGPLTNGALAVVCGLLAAVATDGGVVRGILLMLAYTNGFVAVLNALPGLPLDGGRVLEGIVWALSRSRTTGTVVAGRIGQAVAVLVVAWFVVRPLAQGYQPGVITVLWSAAIGWMLWRGATGSIRYARFRRAAQDVVVGRLMRPAVTVSGAASVADARAAVHAVRPPSPPATGVVPPEPLVVVLDGYGNPVGIVDETAAAAVPPERAGLVQVASVGRGLPPLVLSPHLSGEDLLARLRETPAAEYAVVDGGRVVGVLDWRTVAAVVGAG